MNKEKDVVFLCQFFYPEYVSSATLPFDTAKKLAKEGYSVGALCGYPYEYTDKKSPQKEIVDGIEIQRLKYIRASRRSKIGRIINYFSFIVKALFKMRCLKKYKAVVVYSNPPLMPWVANKAKRKYGCKLIFVAYDLYPEIAVETNSINKGGMIYKLMDKLNTSFYKNLDRVVALSNEMKEYIVANRGIDADKVVVIPNWYEDKYDELIKREITGGDIYEKLNGKTVVSYLGNMGTCQDVQTLLDVAEKLKDDDRFVFLFAGHGNKTAVVQSAQERLSNIVYYDFLHGQDYLDVLKMTSYAVVSLEKGLCGLCVPSKTYAYMMQNLPMICIMDERSDIAKDITETNSGIVVRNGESNKIAEYITGGTCVSKIRERYLEKYTPEIALQKYGDMFAELLEGVNG